MFSGEFEGDDPSTWWWLAKKESEVGHSKGECFTFVGSVV
jgi:hypothetical protein